MRSGMRKNNTHKYLRGSTAQPLLDRFTTVALNAAQLLHQQEWKDKFNTLS